MATRSSIFAVKSHEQKSLVDYTPLSRKESNMTEVTAHAENIALSLRIWEISLE